MLGRGVLAERFAMEYVQKIDVCAWYHQRGWGGCTCVLLGHAGVPKFFRPVRLRASVGRGGARFVSPSGRVRRMRSRSRGWLVVWTVRHPVMR